MLSHSGMLVAKQGRRYDAEPIHQHGALHDKAARRRLCQAMGGMAMAS